MKSILAKHMAMIKEFELWVRVSQPENYHANTGLDTDTTSLSTVYYHTFPPSLLAPSLMRLISSIDGCGGVSACFHGQSQSLIVARCWNSIGPAIGMESSWIYFSVSIHWHKDGGGRGVGLGTFSIILAIHLWPAAPTVKEPVLLTDYHQRENPYVMEQMKQMEYPPLQLTP